MPRSTDPKAPSTRIRTKARQPSAPASSNETKITAAGKSSVAAHTIEKSTINTGSQYPINLVLDKVVYGRLREQNSLALLFTTIAISLSADVARRFLDDGHWLDIAARIFEALLIAIAVAAGVLAFVSLFRPADPIDQEAEVRGLIGSRFKWKKLSAITGVAFLVALGLWLFLPSFAHFYNERGIRLQYREPPGLSGARESYERAVRLAPGFAPAHYNLAVVYEELNNEKAMEEYRLAINYDSRIYAAYNNLARLYLLRGKENDYGSALTILGQALELEPQDENVQYSLNKNLGWTNYELKHYPLAEIYLRKAISLRAENAAAHCLLAYVLKEQGKAGVADECFDCVSFAPGEKDVEATWLRDAQECMMNGGNK